MKKASFFLVLALAVALRLCAVYNYGDFWFDEMFSFTYAQKPWIESLTHFWIWETNPPLYTLVLKVWLYVAPVCEFFVRIPSLLFGVGTVYILYRWLSHATTRHAALLSAFFLALSPYHIFLSATARPYALLLFLATASTSLLWTTFLQPSQKTWWYYSVITILVLYTHFTAWSLVVCHAILIIVLAKPRFKKWLLACAPAIAGWLVWAVPSLMAKFHGGGFTGAWYFNLSHHPKDIIIALQPLLTTYSWWPLTLIIFLAICGGSIYVLYKKKYPADNLILTLLIIQSFLPFLFAGIMGVWNIKFFVISLPFFVALVAYLVEKAFSYLPLQIVILLFLAAPGTFYLLRHNLPLEDWSTVTNYINTSAPPSSTIFLYNNFVYKNQFDRYYAGSVPAIPYLSTTALNWDQMFITQNYWRYMPTQEELNAWYNKNNLGRYRDIFILIDTTVDVNLRRLVEKHGYVQTSTAFYPRLVIPSPIYHYVKSETITTK